MVGVLMYFAGLDIRTFVEQPLLNDAIDLRADLRNKIGGCATWQFSG
jgi:hypothetical protein